MSRLIRIVLDGQLSKSEIQGRFHEMLDVNMQDSGGRFVVSAGGHLASKAQNGLCFLDTHIYESLAEAEAHIADEVRVDGPAVAVRAWTSDGWKGSFGIEHSLDKTDGMSGVPGRPMLEGHFSVLRELHVDEPSEEFQRRFAIAKGAISAWARRAALLVYSKEAMKENAENVIRAAEMECRHVKCMHCGELSDTRYIKSGEGVDIYLLDALADPDGEETLREFLLPDAGPERADFLSSVIDPAKLLRSRLPLCSSCLRPLALSDDAKGFEHAALEAVDELISAQFAILSLWEAVVAEGTPSDLELIRSNSSWLLLARVPSEDIC